MKKILPDHDLPPEIPAQSPRLVLCRGNNDTDATATLLPASQKHLDRRELASRWKTSVSTIKRMEKRGELPALQLGQRLIRFRLKDIIAHEELSR